MMDDGLKQRLIGAIVLVAIGVIFVPSLLDEDGRREIDLNTQVPPEPVVMPRPLEVPEPKAPDNIPPAKELDQNYAHLEPIESGNNPTNANDDDEIEDLDRSSIVDTSTTLTSTKPTPVSGLDENGVPLAWSIQVSSFESENNAVAFEKRLVEAGYSAYIRPSAANGVTVYRVFVGPKINRQTALETKAEIDKAFKTQAMLVEFKP